MDGGVHVGAMIFRSLDSHWVVGSLPQHGQGLLSVRLDAWLVLRLALRLHGGDGLHSGSEAVAALAYERLAAVAGELYVHVRQLRSHGAVEREFEYLLCHSGVLSVCCDVQSLRRTP